MLHSNSRENQDLVLTAIYGGKRNGTYLELGGADPQVDNNTYLLEKQFGWRGVSVDMNGSLAEAWKNNRTNPCLHVDATTIDYNRLFEEHNLGVNIDFLQLDIDGTNQGLNSYSLQVLETLDLDRYHFGFVSFEHNLYLDPTSPERQRSRAILRDKGYTPLIMDVKHGEWVFEDWWIWEPMMPNANWRRLVGEGVNMRGEPTAELRAILEELGPGLYSS